MKLPLFEIGDVLVCEKYGYEWRVAVVYEDTPEVFEYKLVDNKYGQCRGFFTEDDLLLSSMSIVSSQEAI